MQFSSIRSGPRAFALGAGLIACLVLLGTPSPTAAQGPAQLEPLQADDGERGRLVLWQGAGVAPRLELADGRILELPALEQGRYTSLVATGGAWFVAGHEVDPETGRTRLRLVAGSGPVYRELPEPKRIQGQVRQGAVLLLDGQRLGGLAWLEGDDRTRLGIRIAEWTGKRFRFLRWVAPAGENTRLALTGTILLDGTWLLAWAGFDGQDDEIFWSRKVGVSWDEPSRLAFSAPGKDADEQNNEVPDITPTLVRSDGGALLAWSRYDGNDYRLLISRFEFGVWTEPRMMAARGGVFPSFVEGGNRPCVLFRDAGNQSWTVAQLDQVGAPLLIARTDGASPTARPSVLLRDGDEVALQWLGLKRQEILRMEKAR